MISSTHVARSPTSSDEFLHCFQGEDQNPLRLLQWSSVKGLFLLLHFSPILFTCCIPVLLNNLCKWFYAFVHLQHFENSVFSPWISFSFSLLPFVFLIPPYPPGSCSDAISFRKSTLSFKTQWGSALWAPRPPWTYPLIRAWTLGQKDLGLNSRSVIY